jgi:[acyl-carrier-protein] S-malonyltransferase
VKSAVFQIMSLALLFSGQGAQKVGMGKSLYENSPSARSLYDEAGRVLGWDLARISFEGPLEALTETKACQPALFVHGLATLAALKEQGKLIEPKFALGLSLGEVTALTAAEVFDFVTGLRVVAERGRLMQLACEQTSGSMAAVIGEERAKVAQFCQEFDVEIANLNSPGQVVISGDKTKIQAAVAAGKERGFKRITELNVAGAYHSSLMEPARVAFAAYLDSVKFAPPKLTVLSNTTAQPVLTPSEIKEALVKQIVSPVLWEDCVRNVASTGATVFWELGPGAVLAGLARRTSKEWTVKSFAEFSDI